MERAQLESRGDFQDNQFDDGYPRLGDIEIAGPYDWTGVSSPSRKLIYVCESETVGEAACARQIAENLATRAFRRPATERDLARLLPFYEVGRREAQARQPAASSREAQARQPAASSREAQARQPAASSNEGGNFDLGVERLVTAVLLSPDFLYRSIHTSKETVPLSDLELASRLSFSGTSVPTRNYSTLRQRTVCASQARSRPRLGACLPIPRPPALSTVS
jgi:hypothetical protein